MLGEVKAARSKTAGRASSPARFLAYTFLLLAVSLCAHSAELSITVRTGSKPIPGAHIVLLRAGNTRNAVATVLASGTSDSGGNLGLIYSAPAGDVLYIVAEGAPSAAVRLAAVLGTAVSAPSSAVVNELTTVAAAYAMSQFLRNDNIAGPSPALAIAAMTASSLTNATTGQVSGILSRSPNGTETATLATLNTIANLVASCVQTMEKESCQDLFVDTRPPSSVTPANTLDAVHAMARAPWHNVVALYHLAPHNAPYTPGLTGSPEAWVLPIKHAGNGREFNGPDTLALDKDGNIWVANQFEYGSAGTPGTGLIRLIPSGLDAPGAPYSGGGISGPSGVVIDPAGTVWLGNAAGNSISRFDAAGKALSPPEGFRAGRVKRPQGIAADACGNLWIANGGTETITEYPAGDPTRAVVFNDLGVRDPTGIAIDGAGYVWAAGSANNRIAKFGADGKPAPGSPFLLKGISKPIEIAADSTGNIWVTNHNGHSVSQIRPDGLDIRSFPAGEGPWGIAIDGGDNLYIANYKRPGLMVLCGSQPANCPLGKQTGDILSPPSGYTSGGLMRLTSVAVDMAGNVWVANHAQLDPKNKTGGDSLVEFVGLAIPTKTPRIASATCPK
jgi:streptogramin lyase